MWTVGRCIVYTGIRLLLLFIPLFLHFSFSQFFITLSSGTLRLRRLKLGTHLDNGQMYRVYWNQASAIYSSLYFFIILSLNFHSFLFLQFSIHNMYFSSDRIIAVVRPSDISSLLSYQILSFLIQVNVNVPVP